jgi:hypothetical protein
LRSRGDIARDELIVVGGSGVTPLPAGASFSYPRRIDGRPAEIQPNAALLALLLALYEDDVAAVGARHCLISYRSALDSSFVQVPLDGIVPGVFAAGDIPELVSALDPCPVELIDPVDGVGRLVPQDR